MKPMFYQARWAGRWRGGRRWLALAAGWSMMALGLAGCGGAGRLPPAPDDAALRAQQRQVFVDAMKPQRGGRPVVAIVALNEGTEVTDFLLPHAVLQRADVADVRPVAVRRGRVVLTPALAVDVAQSLADFDREFPGGAHIAIVPAMTQDDDPAVMAWLKRQAGQGARILGICSGARVLGRAGLLDGRRFAGHWYDRSTLLRRHARAVHVPHQRYVVDRGVATTTGITASMPALLALVEALGGRERAAALAAQIGLADWTPAHDSAPFGLTLPRAVEYLAAKAAFWRDERRVIDVRDGSDDIALALAADAWARTGHVRVAAVAGRGGSVRLASGLPLAVDPADVAAPRVALAPGLAPAAQLDRTLCEIEGRFGAARRQWAMQEMEYARPLACR
jgi:putative intracellular protease/amidase